MNKVVRKIELFILLLLIVFWISSSGPSWADSDQSNLTVNKGYLQQDPLFKNRTNIYDKSGRKTGSVQQDVIFKMVKGSAEF